MLKLDSIRLWSFRKVHKGSLTLHNLSSNSSYIYIYTHIQIANISEDPTYGNVKIHVRKKQNITTFKWNLVHFDISQTLDPLQCSHFECEYIFILRMIVVWICEQYSRIYVRLPLFLYIKLVSLHCVPYYTSFLLSRMSFCMSIWRKWNEKKEMRNVEMSKCLYSLYLLFTLLRLLAY